MYMNNKKNQAEMAPIFSIITTNG